MDPSLGRTVVHLSRGVLVGVLPAELTPSVLAQLQRDVLTSAPLMQARGIVLDASAVQVMDAEDYGALCALARTCAVMGRPTVVCGLRAGVVSSLVELNVDTRAVATARNPDAAVRWLEARVR